MALDESAITLDSVGPLTGVVLAGGRAERMGGRDKGLLSLAGEPLVAHVIRRLQPQVVEVLIGANRNLDAYRRFGCRVIQDGERERFRGPRTRAVPGAVGGCFGGDARCWDPVSIDGAL